MTETAKRLDIFCKSKKMNYKELAEELGVTPPAIYNIINGKTKKPSADVIVGLERLGINPTWLLTGEGEMLKEVLALPSSKDEVYQSKYFELLETTNKLYETTSKLWAIIAQNGIKVDLGKSKGVEKEPFSQLAFFLEAKVQMLQHPRVA